MRMVEVSSSFDPFRAQFTDVCGRLQRVEKFGIEPIATPNRAPGAPKSVRLVRIWVRFGVNAATKGVFQHAEPFHAVSILENGCGRRLGAA
jgi:hypothetical protein